MCWEIICNFGALNKAGMAVSGSLQNLLQLFKAGAEAQKKSLAAVQLSKKSVFLTTFP